MKDGFNALGILAKLDLEVSQFLVFLNSKSQSELKFEALQGT